MKFGINLGYSMTPQIQDQTEVVQLAERLGYDAIFTAEAYGSDAITPLTWYAARTSRIKLGTSVMQIPARTPAMAASTWATLDQLSGGRCIIGLGMSGPQVVEGYHGVGYRKPLTRTREYVDLIRRFIARDEPVSHEGEIYQLPYEGEGSMGLGKPLKLIIHPERQIPIWLGAQGPKNIEMTAEIGDGWMPLFISPYHFDLYEEPLQRGLEKGGRTWDDLEIAAGAMVVPGDDVEQCAMPVKMMIAFYIGGMGAEEKNFHVETITRYGYGDAAKEIQEKFLSGDRFGAFNAVPTELCDEMALLGPKDRIKERLEVWKQSRITMMVVLGFDPNVIELMADFIE